MFCSKVFHKDRFNEYTKRNKDVHENKTGLNRFNYNLKPKTADEMEPIQTVIKNQMKLNKQK